MQIEKNKKKLKVLHIGYDFNPSNIGRGGVIIYQRALMRAVYGLGWDVSFFVATKHTLSGKIKVKTTSHEGIKVIELINSPMKHCDYMCNPLDHISNEELDIITKNILDEESPDVVHIHDPRLLPASIVNVIKANTIPVIKTMHNYFDLCPQSELMFKGRSLCSDYQDGNKCKECLPSLQSTNYFIEKLSDTLDGTFLYPILKTFWKNIRNIKRRNDTNRDNEHVPIHYSANAYTERRKILIETLNIMDRIHCYSNRSAEILIDNGLDRKKIKLINISTDSIEKITPKPISFDRYPVTFGYLTGESYIKGFEQLLDAFSKLNQKQAKLLLYGFKDADYFNKKYKNLNVEFRRPYSVTKANDIMSQIDIGIIPSIWEEVFGIVGIEFLSARVPVIGSRIGGITEWLKHGENGFLFEAGNIQDLQNKMRLFVNDPGLITRLQKNIKPWKSLNEHAREIVSLYNSILN